MGINAKFEIDEEVVKEGFREILMAQFSPEKQAAMIEAAIAHVLTGKVPYTDESVIERMVRLAVDEQARQIVTEYFADPTKKEEFKSSVLSAIDTFRYESKGKKLMELVLDYLVDNARL